MANPNILFVIGSLRKRSFNHKLADEAAKLLEGRAEVTTLDYSDVPLFNQDEEFPAPAPVAAARKAFQDADAVWIFTPEYNGSYPGSLKNLLDWLSRPLDPTFQDMTTVTDGKLFALTSAAGQSAGSHVRAALTALLGYKGKVLDTQAGIVLPGTAFTTGEYEPSDEDKAQLKAEADALLAAIAE